PSAQANSLQWVRLGDSRTDYENHPLRVSLNPTRYGKRGVYGVGIQIPMGPGLKGIPLVLSASSVVVVLEVLGIIEAELEASPADRAASAPLRWRALVLR